eukprot:PhF_6_TR35703/c0_g1_i1/m.51837
MLHSTTNVSRDVFSPTVDFFAFTVPIIVGILVAPWLYLHVPHDYLPVWGYILIVAFTDVGHVWTTTFRTHLDSEENNRRWFLYNVGPVIILAVSVALHYFSERVFWTMLGYLAIYHFAKQQYGFLALIKSKGPDCRVDWTADKYFLYLGAVFPILMWHSDETRKFDWFNRDDDIAVPLHKVPYSYEFFLCCWVSNAIAFAIRQLQLMNQGIFNRKKVQFIFSCWLTWGIGVLLNHKLIALTFLNLFHAMPAFAIIFCVCKNRWAKAYPTTSLESFVKWICQPGRWPFYAAAFMFIGLVEEILWETMVWHDYTDHIFEWDPRQRFGELGYSFISCLLTLPQSSHYVLDAWIWKQGKDSKGEELNPGLRTYMGLDRAK